MRKQFPKTREELARELCLPYNDEFNKALSELMNEGLVERVENGYCLTNPRGVKAGKKAYEKGEY